ncbi:MAG: site-specific DNA-methyltransferase [Actinomycetota bacterium]
MTTPAEEPVDTGDAAPVRRLRRPTRTSAFGVSKRESHDASGFYDRFTAPELSDDDDVRRLDQSVVDHVWTGDARDLIDLHVAPSSVALVVTSPPYFAGKAYEEELGRGHIPADYFDYLQMLHDVFAACVRALEPGGRIAVNVANLGRKPYRSLSADVTRIFEDLKLLPRGEVVWRKAAGASGSCAWGSYQSPRNPVLRDVTERVIVASKGRFDRPIDPAKRARVGLPNERSILADEFLESTLDVWDLPPESARRVGHPAPFPVELPQRFIELYTYRDDIVLDPFMGAGSTAVAAFRTDRRFLGFDTDPVYVDLTEQRLAGEADAAESAPGPLPDDAYGRARSEGWNAGKLARLALERAGFVDIRDKVKVPAAGVQLGYTARSQDDRLYRFIVAGPHAVHRPGLRRSEIVWRTLGEASALHHADPGPLVVLSTALPSRASSLGKALRAVTGPDQPVLEVIDLLDDAHLETLAGLARGG